MLSREDDLTKPYYPPSFSEKSKFTPRIALATLPAGTKMPSTLGKFDGTGDPDDHLRSFEVAGKCARWTLPAWCHMFAQTLTGAARVWFDSLPNGKIDNLKELTDKFSDHFSQNKRIERDSTDILQVKRRDNESIEDYITRFNREALQIGPIGFELMKAAFTQGVRCDSLIRTLAGCTGMPNTWEEIMRGAKNYAKTERELSVWSRIQAPQYTDTQAQAVHNRNNRHDRKVKGNVWTRLQGADQTTPKPPASQDYQRNTSLVHKPNRRSHNNWTPLTKTPAQVLATENVDFPEPKVIKRREGLDHNKFCAYHQDIGHDTDKCYQLRQAIEDALKSGKLGHLLQNVERKQAGCPPPKKIKNISMMIHSSGHRTQKRKTESTAEWREQQVCFPIVKGGPSATKAIIVTAIFDHYRTTRAFMDTGGNSDIMYGQCFDLLDEEDKQRLRPINSPIMGFSNEIVTPLGEISFPLTLGAQGRSRTEEVTFLVIPSKSKYDIILGRDSMASYNMVTSTVHSAIGFPTPNGVAIVWANRECAMTTEPHPAKMLKPCPRTEPEKWILNPKFPEQPITIGPEISENIRDHLKQLLRKNIDVFAWQPSDMIGVPRELAQHKLNTYRSVEPIAQKRRSMGAEKTQAMNEQVGELLKA